MIEWGEDYSDLYEGPFYSTCIECGENKQDPDEFSDGLRCTECVDRDLAEQQRQEDQLIELGRLR